MIKVNAEHLVKKVNFSSYEEEVKEIHEMIHNKSGAGNDFLGWLNYPSNIDQKEFNDIKGEKFPVRYIGVDVRTRSQLGSILSGFMLCEDTIIYHGLSRNGIKSVAHAPSLPMEITKEQLNESKVL